MFSIYYKNIKLMKHAKIILTAVGLFAIVGGALAFKATRIRLPYFSTNAAGLCTVPTNTFYTTQAQYPGQPIGTITNAFYTTQILGPCPTLTLYFAQ